MLERTTFLKSTFAPFLTWCHYNIVLIYKKVNMRIKQQEEEFEKIWQKNKAKCLRTVHENPIVISLVCEVDTSLYDIMIYLRR